MGSSQAVHRGTTRKEEIMAALSIVKQLNTENTLHDELSYSKFLGENKLARIETFLDKQNVTSLTEVNQTTCIAFLFHIYNDSTLSANQRRAYTSALETAIRCFYESQETSLVAECNALDLKKEVRSKVIFFLSIHHINHISEITPTLRQEYVSYLDYIGLRKTQELIRGFDSVKLSTIEADMNSLRKKEFTYENELMYLGYHPNYKIASKYRYTQRREPLFFDFSLDVPEILKKQIFETLKFVVEEFNERDNHYRIQHFILPLWNLYNFCVEYEITDMTQFTSKNEEDFHLYLSDISEHQLLSDKHIIGVVRKYLFLSAPTINWDANVWYFERFTFTAGRINDARPIEALYFDSFEIADNVTLVKDYMKYLIGLSPRYSIQSVYIAYYDTKELLKYFDHEKVLLKDVKAEHLDAYINAYYLRENIPSTVNKVLGSLSKFFDYLLSKELINPILYPFEAYRMQEVNQHHDLSVDNAYIDNTLSILQEFPEHLRLMFLNLWCIGLRANEVCTIKGNAYSFDGTDAWFLVYQAKAKREKRVPIPMELYNLMTEYIQKNHIPKDGFVFPAPKSKGPYRVGTFTKQMSALLNAHGIDFRSHAFRHTMATDLYTDGAPLQTIREYLGHSNVNMTKQYIDHLPNQLDAKSMEFFSSQATNHPWDII